MKFDIFFSICQTEVKGFMPSEKVMFQQFFDQAALADELGFGCAWVAETHLSCEIQKHNANAVIPHFIGEIGLNTDILQVAHLLFSRTKRMNVGSAIRNIICNGGPIAHAEAIKTFLSLHGLREGEKRQLEIGFASGRFEFSNRPYGMVPRNALEEAAWPVVKGKALAQATEIFLRLLKGEAIATADLQPMQLRREDFRAEGDWLKAQAAAGATRESYAIAPYWNFEKLATIPFDAPLELLRLTIGTHDASTQIAANQYLPVGVFNLSITPPQIIEETHQRMQKHYHASGGPWQRQYMPRTAMVFLDDTPGASEEAKTEAARQRAREAWENYWKAMEGTLDSKKVEQAVGNALVGGPDTIAKQIRAKYHPQDRLMLWFDFNEHDNDFVKASMRSFIEKVAPQLSEA